MIQNRNRALFLILSLYVVDELYEFDYSLKDIIDKYRGENVWIN